MAPKKITLRGVAGVCVERNLRVSLDGTYVVLGEDEGRNGTVTLTLKDPKATYLGGDDGKQKLPCTIRARVPVALL